MFELRKWIARARPVPSKSTTIHVSPFQVTFNVNTGKRLMRVRLKHFVCVNHVLIVGLASGRKTNIHTKRLNVQPCMLGVEMSSKKSSSLCSVLRTRCANARNSWSLFTQDLSGRKHTIAPGRCTPLCPPESVIRFGDLLRIATCSMICLRY